MKVIRFDHEEQTDVSPSPFADFHDMQVLGCGVKVTVMESDGAITVHVDPSGEPYMHALKVSEVASSDIQIRVSRVRGTSRL